MATPSIRSGLACPTCGEFTASWVVDSRTQAGTIRRRRECKKCSERYTTVESVLDSPANSMRGFSKKQKLDHHLKRAAFHLERARTLAGRASTSRKPEAQRT